MWKIDRDYICEDGEVSRVGTIGNGPNAEKTVRFRLKDDDGEVYYGGWLHDDEECDNQSYAYDFGRYDAGTCHIEVKRDGKWVEEIG